MERELRGAAARVGEKEFEGEIIFLFIVSFFEPVRFGPG